MSEEPVREARPRRRWKSVLLSSVLAVYGPFWVAASVTWLFVPCTWCKQEWLKIVWVLPGAMVMNPLKSLFGRMGLRLWSLSGGTGLVVAGLLSMALVAGVVWISRRGLIAQLVTLIVVTFFSAYAAQMSFLLMLSAWRYYGD